MVRYSFLVCAIVFAVGCGDAPSTPTPPRAEATPPQPTSPTGPQADEAVPGEIANESSEDAAGQWGSLMGRFVLIGDPPALDPIQVSKDRETCGETLVNESLLVNACDRGIANVFVWLRSANVPIHPQLESASPEDVEISIRGCRFVPHALTVRTGQRLIVNSEDDIGHSPRLQTRTSPQFGINLPQLPYVVDLTRAEPDPVSLVCSIHPWMHGWVLVQDHPYMAVTDEHGRFTIEKLPVGMWEFRAWHERSGYLEEVSMNETTVQWSRGHFTVEITDQPTDLGEITLSPQLFETEWPSARHAQ